MDAMVTARVPVEIKRQGGEALERIGSTVTELVNAAYDYLLAFDRLPGVDEGATGVGAAGTATSVGDDGATPTIVVKELSATAAEAFRELWDARSVIEDLDYDGDNFKELLDEARDERYARFA